MISNLNKQKNDSVFRSVMQKFDMDSDAFYFDNDILISTHNPVGIGDYPPLLQNNIIENMNHINEESMINQNNQTTDSLLYNSTQPSIILPEGDYNSLSARAVPDTESQPKDHFLEQDELQGYTLIEKIGEGAFAKVFRAIPNKYGHKSCLLKNYSEVAIKVARKEMFFNNNNNDDISRSYNRTKCYCPEHHRYHHHRHKHLEKYADASKSRQLRTTTWEDIQREVLIHKTVSSECPHIVSFIDFQESYSYYYIVMEKVNGGDVFNQLLKYTYFSEDLTRHIVYQLAIAVKHLHQVGVAHRDIKLENILFESIDYIPSKKPYYRKSDNKTTKIDEGEFIKGKGGAGIGCIKLTDFGLSKKINMNSTATPCGTLGYTAPEVLTKDHYSTKVDIWGIGCVLYTLLCGFPPFYEEDSDKLKRNICEGKYTFLEPWWDEISSAAKVLVSKLLETDPNKRYDIDDLLNDPWLNNYDCNKKKSKSFDIVLERGRKSTLFDDKISIVEKSNLLHSAFSKSNDIQRTRQDNTNTELATRFITKPKQSIQSKLQRAIFITPNPNPNPNFKLDLNSSTIFTRRRRKNKILNIKENFNPWSKYTQRQRYGDYMNIS